MQSVILISGAWIAWKSEAVFVECWWSRVSVLQNVYHGAIWDYLWESPFPWLRGVSAWMAMRVIKAALLSHHQEICNNTAGFVIDC